MSLWLFGYGSLIWNPGFAFLERRKGYAPGWERRFWQGSTDHRGVPGAPGRVVTLVQSPLSGCWGVAYRITEQGAEDILAALDQREQGGYTRQLLQVLLDGQQPQSCLTYRARPDNPEYLGPAPTRELVRQIATAAGPSGANRDYLRKLAQALRGLGQEDPHVFELEAFLLEEIL